MENLKRRSKGKHKQSPSVLSTAMLIGSVTVAASSYTGTGLSASAVFNMEE